MSDPDPFEFALGLAERETRWRDTYWEAQAAVDAILGLRSRVDDLAASEQARSPGRFRAVAVFRAVVVIPYWRAVTRVAPLMAARKAMRESEARLRDWGMAP